jgi:hypothetical protein
MNLLKSLKVNLADIAFVVIVVKAVASSINIAEALVAIGSLVFIAYNKYLDSRKPREVSADFNVRLESLESRVALASTFSRNR